MNSKNKSRLIKLSLTGKNFGRRILLAIPVCLFFYLVSCKNDVLETVPASTESTNSASVDGKPDFSLVGFASQNGGTTGGENGRIVTAASLSDFTKFATSTEKLIINISGKISAGTAGASVNVKANKSIVGVGADAFLEGVGLNIKEKNIIIRNIKFTMSAVTKTYSNDEGRQQVEANDGDCITIQGVASNIWIDHCEFYNKDPKTQTNQDLYDGLIDAKGKSAYITISWCYFHDHHKCHLVGSSDNDKGDRKMTFHHNYYYNIKERLPSYRYGTAHVFNNYFKHIPGSGANSRMGACVRVEKNYFEDTNDPVTTKNSKSNGGWNVIDNYYAPDCVGSKPTTSTCTSFTPAYNYSSALHDKTVVKDIVTLWAGVGKI